MPSWAKVKAVVEDKKNDYKKLAGKERIGNANYYMVHFQIETVLCKLKLNHIHSAIGRVFSSLD